jgi:excisionase family DNA binding protein
VLIRGKVPIMDAKFLPRDEAARYMRVSASTIDRWAREGRIKRYRVEGTRSVRFKVEELDALVVRVDLDPYAAPDTSAA